jgi:Fur family transcriptional regulator, ferric uptake regulator
MATPTADEDAISSIIRGAAKRVTVAKRTVAAVLSEATSHLTVDEITLTVQQRQADVSPSTVYRILEEFEELGIVEHAHMGQQAVVYHLAGAAHGHLTCELCRTTFEIPAAYFDVLSKNLLTTFGFRLDRHHVALSGTCEVCRDHPHAL